MVSAKINFLSVHQCTLQCTLTGSFPLFDFFDLTQIIFYRNLCKLLNIKIDVRAKFQIQSNEKGKLIFSTSLSSGATGNRTGDTGILTILYNCLLVYTPLKPVPSHSTLCVGGAKERSNTALFSGAAVWRPAVKSGRSDCFRARRGRGGGTAMNKIDGNRTAQKHQESLYSLPYSAAMKARQLFCASGATATESVLM